MARIGNLLFAFFACFLVSVGAAPTDLESRDFIGGIINDIGLGLVAQINSYITVRVHCC